MAGQPTISDIPKVDEVKHMRDVVRPSPRTDRAHGASEVAQGRSRRWTALVIIALAQLMIALDATIMSIALPSVQIALHIADAHRQWVITAYTLAFGGLLLLGGRIADSMGRKRTFLIGLAGFAAASGLGGAAPSLGLLVGARALQGAFGAILAPTALSLLVVTFTEARDRAKAFAVYGGIAGCGGVAGLILGGVLTEYVNWRWCLYVNIPIAVIALFGSWIVLSDSRTAGRSRFDLLGVVLVTGALAALVYACSEAVGHGWGSRTVVVLLGAGSVLLVLFVWHESRTVTPLLPLRILVNRNRGGAYLAVALAIVGMFGLFLLLTYYFQVVLHYSPVQAGVAFLPLTAALLISSGAIASRLLPHVAPRALMVPGLLVASAGMAVLTQLQVDSGYITHILPAEILLGLGIGCVMVPAISTATSGVEPRDVGVASATVTTAQQIGGSIGTALLNTIAASATASYLTSHPQDAVTRTASMIHGYAVATAYGAGILVVAAVLAAIMITIGKPAKHPGDGPPMAVGGPSTTDR